MPSPLASFRFCPLATLAFTLTTHAAPAPQSGAEASIVAGPVPVNAIRLDGELDEVAWTSAPAVALTQQDPHPNQPSPYRTRVRVLADATHLYVGIDGIDPDLARLSVHTLERDSDQSEDDHLTIVLDTLGQRRLGYVFQVNAGGGRSDGLISPASRDPAFDWDGIWDARVRRTADGWSAEIAIDSRSLQFRPGLDRWGLNVQRYVPRDQVSLQWASISLDSAIFDLARTGALRGIGGLEQGHGLEVSPSAVINYRDTDRRASLQVGGDVRCNLTPGITATLTVNPDFAEAEADTGQINLTRFPLFFPEKRRFFSEGSNQFTFAAGLTDNNTFLPFYSRRIGLVDGEAVRVDAGVKVVGSAGPWSIGALDVHTGRGRANDPANLFVGRLSYDVDPHLRVGTLLTRGDPDGLTDNRFAGVDAVWRTATFRGDKNLTLSGWLGRSSDPLPGGHSGWGVFAEYPNDLWRGYVNINTFGDALLPALGFLPRPGTRQYDVYVAYRPRPTSPSLRWARQFYYQLELEQVDDLRGVTQTRRIFTAPFNVSTASGAHYEFNWIPTYEALSEPFEIADGVVLPQGRYHFDRYRVEAQSSDARPWRIGNVMEVGTFYTGRLTQVSPFVDWTARGGQVRFELSNETNFGHLPQGDFIQRLYRVKASYAFNPDLIVSTLAQYDSTAGRTGANARLQWTIAPGRELFLVFNHGVEGSASTTDPRALKSANSLIAKLRWNFRW